MFEDFRDKQENRYDLAVVLIIFILMECMQRRYLPASEVWRLKGWEPPSRREGARPRGQGAQRGPSTSRGCAQQPGKDSRGRRLPREIVALCFLLSCGFILSLASRH